MIRINLLPSTMRKQFAGREGSKITVQLGNKVVSYGLGTVATVLVLSYLGLVLLPSWFTRMGLARWQKKWGMIEKQFNEVNSYVTQEKQFLARLGELAKKKKDRVRWAQLLNAISDVVPPSIQLVRISSGPLVEMVPMPAKQTKSGSPAVASGEQTQAPTQKIRRTIQVLELEGVAEKGLLGEEDLNTLMQQMRINSVFNDYFERVELVGVVSLPDSTKKFSLRCRFKVKAPWQPSQA